MKYFYLFAIFILLISCGETKEEKAWKESEKVLTRINAPVFPDKVYNITDFGAVEGKEDYSVNAINAAIDSCSKDGGGTVVVPNGTFYTGPVELKSNVCLHLSDKSVLKFSVNPKDYIPFVVSRWQGYDCINYRPLIYAYMQKNIAVTGNGILDGQSDKENWWPWKGKKKFGWTEGTISQNWNEGKQSGWSRLQEMSEKHVPIQDRVMNEDDCLRPCFVEFVSCENILLKDFTINRAPFWQLHPLLSKNITVKGVRMESLGPNNDGCDPESCSDVLIEDCYFNTGDDCIAIKSGRNEDGREWGRPSENVIIRNCNMANGHGGVVIGSEISGGCRNVWVENCKMDSPELDRVVRIKSNPVRGGLIENLYVRNIEVGQCKEAVLRVEMKYENVTKGPNMPEIRNIFLSKINSGQSTYGVWIDGFDDHINVHGVRISDCSFDNVSKGNKIVGADNIVFDNVLINGKKVAQ